MMTSLLLSSPWDLRRLQTFCSNVSQRVLTKVSWYPTEQSAVPIHGATSNTLEAAIKKWEKENGPADLIFAGRQAIDGDTAQVGPQIAEKLDLPQVTYVEEFHIDDNLHDITVKRQLEDGYELIGIKTPCMLTAIKELNDPRYMNMKGIFGEKDIKIWNAKDIEVDLNKVGLEASPTNVFRSFTPAPKAPGQVVAGDTENEQAKNLLVQLKGKHII